MVGFIFHSNVRGDVRLVKVIVALFEVGPEGVIGVVLFSGETIRREVKGKDMGAKEILAIY